MWERSKKHLYVSRIFEIKKIIVCGSLPQLPAASFSLCLHSVLCSCPPRPPPGLMWTAVCRACQLIISAVFAPSSSVHWDTPTYWKYLGTQAGLPLEPPDVWRWLWRPDGLHSSVSEALVPGFPIGKGEEKLWPLCSSFLNHRSPGSANAVVRSRIRSLYTTLFGFTNKMEGFLCDLQRNHSFFKNDETQS